MLDNYLKRFCQTCKGASSVSKTHEGKYVCSICSKAVTNPGTNFSPTKEELEKFLTEARKILITRSYW